MKRLLIVCLMFLFLVGVGSAATYNFYFSDDNAGNLLQGSDSNPCTIAQPCKNLNKTQDLLDSLESTDSATFWFDSGDTWDASKPNKNWWGGRITDWTSTRDGVFVIENGDVTFTSYGSGPKPVFDGGEDFSSNPLSSTRQSADAMILIQSDNFVIDNIEFKNHHGNGLTSDADLSNLTIQNCKITYMGGSGIQGQGYKFDVNNVLVQYNEVAYCNRNYFKGYSQYWGSAISFNGGNEAGDVGFLSNAVIQYNYVHHHAGEGIVCATHYGQGSGNLVQYNIIGSGAHTDIHTPTRNYSAGKITVRYNLLYSTAEDRALGYDSKGLYYEDETAGGSQSTADYEFYGNIVIAKTQGIYFGITDNSPFGKLRVYKNLFIDSSQWNLVVSQWFQCNDAGFYNNSFIYYDETGNQISVMNTETWTASTNHFYGGTIPSSAPWNNNMKTGDPKLLKTSGWRSLTGVYDINFSRDLYPLANSPLNDIGITEDYLRDICENLPLELGCGATQSVGCVHEAEIKPCDGKVSRGELDDYVAEWKSNSGVTLVQVIEAIGIWKSGGY